MGNVQGMWERWYGRHGRHGRNGHGRRHGSWTRWNGWKGRSLELAMAGGCWCLGWSNLVYIKEKLVNVFPVLAERIFSVSWTDEDGDVITIDTDEELILALTELAGPVYKLTATVRGAKKVEQPQEPVVGANVTHHGVTCSRPRMATSGRCST